MTTATTSKFIVRIGGLIPTFLANDGYYTCHAEEAEKFDAYNAEMAAKKINTIRGVSIVDVETKAVKMINW